MSDEHQRANQAQAAGNVEVQQGDQRSRDADDRAHANLNTYCPPAAVPDAVAKWRALDSVTRESIQGLLSKAAADHQFLVDKAHDEGRVKDEAWHTGRLRAFRLVIELLEALAKGLL